MSEAQRPIEADPSVTFVTNMKQARESQGIGRKQFAERMQEHGHKWHESVVPKVENQTRALKLGEAIAVADILNMSVEQLATQNLDPRTAAMARLLGRLEAVHAQLCDVVPEYTMAQVAFEKLQERQPDALAGFAAKAALTHLGTFDFVDHAKELRAMYYNGAT